MAKIICYGEEARRAWHATLELLVAWLRAKESAPLVFVTARDPRLQSPERSSWLASGQGPPPASTAALAPALFP